MVGLGPAGQPAGPLFFFKLASEIYTRYNQIYKMAACGGHFVGICMHLVYIVLIFIYNIADPSLDAKYIMSNDNVAPQIPQVNWLGGDWDRFAGPL